MEITLPEIDDSHLLSLADMQIGFTEFKNVIRKSIEENSKLSFDELEKLFFRNVKHIPQMIGIDMSLDNAVYRVRVLSPEEDRNLISTYSYPPANLTRMGRANIEGHPVFYCSLDQNTAIRETLLKNSKQGEFYLTKWEPFQPALARPTVFLFDDAVNLKEGPLEMNKSFVKRLQRMGKKYHEETAQTMYYLFTQIGNLFIDDDWTASSFIAHNILYRNAQSNPLMSSAILYPSKESKMKSVNFAIAPGIVDKYFNLINVFHMRFNEDVDGELRLSVMQKGIPDSNKKIIWKAPVFREKDIIVKGIEFGSAVPSLLPELNEAQINDISKATKEFLLQDSMINKLISKLEANGSDPETEKYFEVDIDMSEMGYSVGAQLTDGRTVRFDHSKVRLKYKSVYEDRA